MLAVLRVGKVAYGMVARREIERVTGRDVAIGAVYATLDRLEAEGLVSSMRSSDTGASRRHFAVTPRGIRTLADTRAMGDRRSQGVSTLQAPRSAPSASQLGPAVLGFEDRRRT